MQLHTTSPGAEVPQTTVSSFSSEVPHTTVSSSQVVPQTTVSSLVSLLSHAKAGSFGDQVIFEQSAPPHAEPQTMLIAFSAQSGVQQVVPQGLVPAPEQSAVEHVTPHVAGWPPGIVAAPHRTAVAQALAVAVRRPPLTR